MMNLDDDNYVPPPTREARDPIHCPECGTTDWYRIEYGTYTERHTLSTATHAYGDDWTDNETDYEGDDGWLCNNKHKANDDTLDLIMRFQD
jgi:hypothetical protein